MSTSGARPDLATLGGRDLGRVPMDRRWDWVGAPGLMASAALTPARARPAPRLPVAAGARGCLALGSGAALNGLSPATAAARLASHSAMARRLPSKERGGCAAGWARRGCSSSCCAVGRAAGSLASMPRNRTLKAGLHCGRSSGGSPDRTACQVSESAVKAAPLPTSSRLSPSAKMSAGATSTGGASGLAPRFSSSSAT